ncbi:beta strand repeat-containing protein, partial [Aquirufa nivalisilvae]
MAFWVLFLFTLNFNLIAQRSFSPVAASYSNAAVMPFAQDIFVNHTDSLDYTLAKKRILKAKNGVDFHLRSFFTKSDYQDQLFKFFPGKHKQMDASFIEKAELLKKLVLGNGLYVPIQFVKWENMHGAMASYSSIGPDGRPRIYMNKEYSEGRGNFLYPDATDNQLISLLFQEYGHAIDDYLNGLDDSPGDEGDLFAVRVLKLDVTERYVETVLVRNDHNKIKVEGKDIFVEDAGVYLLEAWPATTASGGGTTWTTGAAKSTNTPLRLETAVMSNAWNATTGTTASITATFWNGVTSISGVVNYSMTAASPANSVLGFLTGGSGTAGYLLELPNSTTTLVASTAYTFANNAEGTIVQNFVAATSPSIGPGSTLTLGTSSRGAAVTTSLTAQAKNAGGTNINGITATFSSTSGTASITGTNPATTSGSGGNTGKAAVTVSDTKAGSTVFNCELKNATGWYVIETVTLTVTPLTASKLAVTGSGTQTAGGSQTITITAQDTYGNTATTYTGAKNLTFSGANSSPGPVTAPTAANSTPSDIAFGSTTSDSFTAGVATTTLKLYDAETALIAVTDGTLSATGSDRLSIVVSPSTMTKLSTSIATPQTNATAFTGTNTLTALDAYGNTATSFNASTNNITVSNTLGGTVSSLGSGANNVLNQAGDFTSGVADLTAQGMTYTGTSGTGTFTFTPASGTAITSGSIVVNPGAATKLVITGTSTQTAGNSQNITLTAYDVSGNVATSYTGDKTLTFSGANSSINPATNPTVTDKNTTAINFGTGTVITFTNGVASSVPMSLYKAESAVVAVTDGSISAAGADRLTVAVSAAAFDKLVVSLTSPQINGTAFTGTNTLTAQDAYGNTVTTFAANTNNVTVTTSLTGTVSGLGSGVNNVLNQAGDFVSGVANLTSLGLKFTGTSGAGTFTFTPVSGTAATSSSVTVNPGAATKLVVTGTGTQTAGGSQTVTVTAQDASGNTATTYTGAKNITFSGATASSSPVTNPTVAATNFGTATSLTFTAGVATGSMILYKAESATVNATDGTINSNTGGTLNVTVSASTMTKLAVSLTSPQINGTAFTGTNTLTAQDAYGNTVTTFAANTNNVTVTTSLTGTVSGLGSGVNHVLNQAGDFVSGVANLTSLGLKFTGTSGAGTFTFTPATGTAATSSSVTINSGAATKLVVTGTGTQAAGGTQTVTVTAQDASGNTVTTYTGAKNITFSGAAASPSPATTPTVAGTNFGTATSLTFTAGVATGSMVLYKAESATVNATDGTINSNTGGTLNVTVSPATFSKLVVSLTSPQINGTAFTGTNTLTAQDAYGNTVTTFAANTNNVTVTTSLTGTVSGLGSGVNNVLNQAGDFVSGVANLTSLGLKFTGTSGAGTFTFTPASGTAATSSSITVSPGAATRLVVTGTGTQTAGASNSITITAKDVSGNTVTTYTGSKNLTFSGATSSTAPVTTPKVTNSSATDIAFGTATALTFASGTVTTNMKLYNVESAVVAVTDGSISAAGADRLTVAVSASTMTKLAVSLTSPQINGTAFTGTNTLTAQDAYGNTVTTFAANTNNVTVTTSLTGTVSGLGSGVNNVLNQAGDFVSGVANLTSLGLKFTGTSGAGTFTFTPVSGTAATSSSITVNPGAATRLVVTGTGTQTAGASNSITITAKDASGNTVTTYTGSKNLTFSGATSSSSPVTTPKVTNSSATDIAFGTATALTFASGAVTTNMKLYNVESAVVAVTDGSISAAGADRLTVAVSASTMTKLAVSLTSPQI